MKQKAKSLFAATIAAVAISGVAQADQIFQTTSCITGEPAITVIEEGRSEVPTAPMITYEEQRANLAPGGSRPSGDTREPAPETPPEAPPEVEEPSDNVQTSPSDDGHYIPASLTAQEQTMLKALNSERVANGKEPLAVDLELTGLARLKSADMLENRYFAHESPTYGKAADMLDEFDYDYTSVGENIAKSASVEKAHAALMSSTNHRRNILGSQWRKVGIGIVNDANGYPYITQLFVR